MNDKDFTVEIWDKRAKAWEKDYNDPQKNKSEDRIKACIDYLGSRNVLEPDCDVLDIGCGPGRFAVAFAGQVNSVTGIDFSPKMIDLAKDYAVCERKDNISFKQRDFHTMDIEEEKLENKFDLVFASNTPILQGTDDLNKAIRMSRKYCFNISLIHSENQLESRIMSEVFGRERHSNWDWRWYSSMFNSLFLMGYYPVTDFYRRKIKNQIEPGSDYSSLFMEKMLQPEERNDDCDRKIKEWMSKNADAKGSLVESGELWYGHILWDVRCRTDRP